MILASCWLGYPDPQSRGTDRMGLAKGRATAPQAPQAPWTPGGFSGCPTLTKPGVQVTTRAGHSQGASSLERTRALRVSMIFATWPLFQVASLLLEARYFVWRSWLSILFRCLVVAYLLFYPQFMMATNKSCVLDRPVLLNCSIGCLFSYICFDGFSSWWF